MKIAKTVFFICHIKMYYFCLRNVHDLKIQPLDNKKKPRSANTLERINSARSPLPPHFNFNSPSHCEQASFLD